MLLKTDLKAIKQLVLKETNSHWTNQHKSIIANEIVSFQTNKTIGQTTMLNKIQSSCNEINASLPKISRLEKYKNKNLID